MSSAVVSTSAALGRPFVFDDDADAGSVARLSGLHRGDQAHAAGICHRPRSSINHQQSKIKNPPGARNPGLAARNSSRAGDGFERHPRHRRPDRRPAARMSDRNLRPRLLGTHHLTPRRSGRRHPPRRILRGGRCQRRARSPLRRRRRRGTGPPAVGALRRRPPRKNSSPQRRHREKRKSEEGAPFLARPLREKWGFPREKLPSSFDFALAIEGNWVEEK